MHYMLLWLVGLRWLYGAFFLSIYLSDSLFVVLKAVVQISFCFKMTGDRWLWQTLMADTDIIKTELLLWWFVVDVSSGLLAPNSIFLHEINEMKLKHWLDKHSSHFFRFVEVISNGPIILSNTSVPFNNWHNVDW